MLKTETETILYVIIISAKIPSGWTKNDSKIFPEKIMEIECPNPQPGQKSNPRFDIGQIVKWFEPKFAINAK